MRQEKFTVLLKLLSQFSQSLISGKFLNKNKNLHQRDLIRYSARSKYVRINFCLKKNNVLRDGKLLMKASSRERNSNNYNFNVSKPHRLLSKRNCNKIKMHKTVKHQLTSYQKLRHTPKKTFLIKHFSKEAIVCWLIVNLSSYQKQTKTQSRATLFTMTNVLMNALNSMNCCLFRPKSRL